MNVRKFIVFVIVILILLGIYLYCENNCLEITNYEIIDDKIPKSLDNYKIVHISDFHNTQSSKLNKDLVKVIKRENPHIIVITGDLIDSRRTDINKALNFVKKIINFAPIFYVTGNHESRVEDYNNLKKELTNLGVHVLDNQVEFIKIDESQLELIGVNDPTFYNKNDLSEEVIIKDNLDKLVSKSDNYKILLSHRPELFDVYVDSNVNLVFSGHAHGGQIRFPFVGCLYIHNQVFFPKYVSGLVHKYNTFMAISRGIGNSLFPFRINNRPELVVVTLKNKN